MSWFSPVINAGYCQARKSGFGYNLTRTQKAQIRRTVNRYRKKSPKRADLIRQWAIRLGCYEGTVRRAAK